MHRKYISPVLLPLLFLCVTASADAQSMDWEEAPQFEVGINGKPHYEVRVFQPSNSKPYLLLLLNPGTRALFFDLGAKRISEIQSRELTVVTEYVLTTNGLPKGKSVGQYSIKGGVTVFSFAGKSYTIRVKESLVGDVSEAMILAHSPFYKVLRDKYTSKKASMEFLKSYKKKTDLVVMFATWCPTCKNVIPQLFRLLKDASNPQFHARFIAIAMGGQEPRAELEKYGHEYPDIIVLQNGVEKGRITGEPNKTLEETLVAILKK